MTTPNDPTPSELQNARRPVDSSVLRRWVYLLILTVAGGTLTAAILRVEPLLSANDRSRWSTVWSLVERGTYQIDEIDALPKWNTIDKVRHEGHFYSSKPPLLATLYAGVYWLVRGATGWTLLNQTNDVARAILIITHLIPWLAGLVVVCRLAERYLTTDTARYFLVVSAAFGTLLTTFCVTINNHTPAAIAVICAIYSTLRVLEAQEPTSGRCDATRFPAVHAIIAGFSCGFAATCELPAASFAGLVFLLLLWKSPKLAFLAFVPAALVPLAALLGTNYAASGGWKPFYSYYGTEKYRYIHEGVPSHWMDPKGLDRAVDSPLVYFMHCTIGHHGLFSLTPLWLLSVAGWGMMGRDRTSPLRPVLGIGLVTTVVVLAFYMSRKANYNYGGNCAGLRWMLWVTPLLLLAMIPAVERWGEKTWFRAAAAGLLAVSVFSAHVGLGNPWKQPWLFTLMKERWGWLQQYNEPPPPRFSRPLTTWFASIPEPAKSGEHPWIELTGADSDGRHVSWTLSVEPPPSDAPADWRQLRLVRTVSEDAPDDQRFLIDRKDFDAGKPPEEFLRWEATPAPAERTAAAALLRGLPAASVYQEDAVRYLRLPVQSDALRCQRAKAGVAHRLTGTKIEAWFRANLWIIDEAAGIPFGVGQFEVTVTDPATGEVVSRRLLTISRFSRGGK